MAPTGMTAYARSSAGRAAVPKTAGRRIEANRAIPSRVYDYHPQMVGPFIVPPALALFVSKVGPAWAGLHVDAIVTTLNALGILAGALIGVSAPSNSAFDSPHDHHAQFGPRPVS